MNDLETLQMFRNIRKSAKFTPATIIVFYEMHYMVSRLPDISLSRSLLARRLNMSPDTIIRALNTLQAADAIHYEGDRTANEIHSIVINPKGKF